jgi:hypothetical protein
MYCQPEPRRMLTHEHYRIVALPSQPTIIALPHIIALSHYHPRKSFLILIWE